MPLFGWIERQIDFAIFPTTPRTLAKKMIIFWGDDAGEKERE